MAVLRRVRVEMRPESAGGGEEGEDVMGLEDAPDVGPCEERPEVEVVWATIVAVCEASAEPKPSSMGAAKTEANVVSAAGEFSPRPG